MKHGKAHIYDFHKNVVFEIWLSIRNTWLENAPICQWIEEKTWSR